jgi:glutaredoxin
MKTVYSKDNCPGCETLKAQLVAAGEPFKELKLGKDITVQEFLEKFPGVRTVPHVVEEKE